MEKVIGDLGKHYSYRKRSGVLRKMEREVKGKESIGKEEKSSENTGAVCVGGGVEEVVKCEMRGRKRTLSESVGECGSARDKKVDEREEGSDDERGGWWSRREKIGRASCVDENGNVEAGTGICMERGTSSEEGGVVGLDNGPCESDGGYDSDGGR